MSHPVKAFQDAAATTRMTRANEKAQAAIEAGNEKSAHIAALFDELRALPAAPHGVSFKGGMAGEKGSICYTDTYRRENKSAPLLFIDTANDITITVYQGYGYGNKDQGETITVRNQLEALNVIGTFLGSVAPEREVEVVPALARAATACRAQNQLKNDGSARWAARP